MGSDIYRGRFAPSPTGRLHAGSLVAALGSYLRARHFQGEWLVRMEDIDSFREEKGAASDILKTLEAHRLYWDGEVVYQTDRHAFYEQALSQLDQRGVLYRCICTRKGLKQTARMGEYGVVYPGTCRASDHHADQRHAIRIVTDDHLMCFDDLRHGKCSQRLESEIGDFIIKRSDGVYSYQLAVVVDDYKQGITEIVRGDDLLSNTVRQIYLQQLLNYPDVQYFHLPLVVNELGDKLSKQTFAPVLDNAEVTANLLYSLSFLGFDTSHINPKDCNAEDLLEWALTHIEQSILL